MIQRAAVGRFNLRIALDRLAIRELGNRVVAFKRDAFLVREIGHGIVAKNGRAVLVFQDENFVIPRLVGKGSARQSEHCDQGEQSGFHV